VMNLKGGVGKTVTSLNLAACLANMGHKTLLVDLDPQANATSGLNIKAKITVYSILVGTKAPAKAIHKTAYENLSIMPSEINLAGAEVEIRGIDASYRLWEALEWIKDDFRFIIIDCPPSLSVLTINALAACDSVIVPVQCDSFASESLDKLMEAVEMVRQVNEDLHVGGVLLTMYEPGNPLSVETAERVKGRYGGLMFNSIVRRETLLSESASKGVPIIHYMKDSEASKSYFGLAREVSSHGR
jgi:chromosome partitioning protein